MVRALKEFVAKESALPLSATIPDMKSDTEQYVALQNLYAIRNAASANILYRYHKKAERDREVYKKLLNELMEQHHRPTVSDDEIERFCRNSKHLRVIRCNTLKQELESANPKLIRTTPVKQVAVDSTLIM